MCFFVRRGAIRIGRTSQGYRKSGYVAKGRLTIDIKPTVLQVVTYTLDQVRWVVHDKYLAIVVTEEWVVDGDTKECFEQVDVGRSLITDHQQHSQANSVKFARARL